MDDFRHAVDELDSSLHLVTREWDRLQLIVEDRDCDGPSQEVSAVAKRLVMKCHALGEIVDEYERKDPRPPSPPLRLKRISPHLSALLPGQPKELDNGKIMMGGHGIHPKQQTRGHVRHQVLYT